MAFRDISSGGTDHGFVHVSQRLGGARSRRVLAPGHDAAVARSLLPRGALETVLWIVLSVSAGFCKVIGLIGGMSWQSSAEYYRINETTAPRLGPLHSARSLMYTVDFHEIERMQHRKEWARGKVPPGSRTEPHRSSTDIGARLFIVD